MTSPDLESKYELLNVLGQGGEGTVYLARDKRDGSNHILKIFHTPMQGTSVDGLRAYSTRIQRNDVGLQHIRLIESAHQVNALHYPFIPLQKVHWRLLTSRMHLGQALFGSYCRMQHYLISQCRVALTDTDVSHFLLAEDGQFHYIDYGFAIKSIDHARYLDEGRLGYGFTMLLLSIYRKNLKLETLPTPGYDYNAPCRYCFSKQLDTVAEEYPWVKEIVSQVRGQNSSIFLDPDFYQRLGSQFPYRVLFPQLVIRTSSVLLYLGELNLKKTIQKIDQKLFIRGN
jgi:hypothetical protein